MISTHLSYDKNFSYELFHKAGWSLLNVGFEHDFKLFAVPAQIKTWLKRLGKGLCHPSSDVLESQITLLSSEIFFSVNTHCIFASETYICYDMKYLYSSTYV